MRPPSVSHRLHRLLLRLQPRDVRDRFGDEMQTLFAARLERARAAGSGATVRFWLSTFGDAIASAWRARRAPPSRLTSTSARAVPGLLADAQTALRVLRRAPARSAAVVGLVALTVGSTVAVSAVAHAVLVAAPPFAASDRVVAVWEQRIPSGSRNVVGAHEFPAWIDRTTTFEHLAAFIHGDAHLTGGGDPIALAGVRVTSRFFDVFASPLALGRGFHPEEDVPGAPRVAVISHALWRDRFGGDRTVVGRQIAINDLPATVVGVAAAGFTFPAGQAGRAADVWMPIAEPIHLYRGRHYLRVVGRLGEGVSIATAATELASVARSLEAEWPDSNRGHGALVTPLFDDLVRDARPAIMTIVVAVAILALVGLVNVAGLASASAAGRQSDHLLCLALGAGRSRLSRQLAIESVALSFCGCLVGVLAGYWIVGVLPAIVPAGALPVTTIGVTSASAWVAAALAIASAGAGCLTAILMLPSSPGAAIRTSVSSGPRPFARSGLVIAQVALTFALLASSGVVIDQWRAMAAIDVGFSPAGVMTFDLALPPARYDGGEAQRRFFTGVIAGAKRIPGVTGAATASLLPLGGGRSTVAITVEGRPEPAPGQEPSVSYRVVGADYFRMLDIPLIRGRAFDDGDMRLAVPLIRWYARQPEPPFSARPQPTPVAVVDETMAERIWPGEDPVGRRIRVLWSPWVTIVGVAGRTQNWTRAAQRSPELYLSDLQEPVGRTNVLVQTEGDVDAVVPAVRAIVRDLDAGLPIIASAPLDDVTAAELGLPRLTSVLSGSFAAAAVVLTATGVYALLAFITAARTREIGVRMALGATRASVRWLVLRQSFMMTAAGLSLGAAGWLGLTAWLRERVPGLVAGPADGGVVTGAVVAATIVAVTMALASEVPVRRALGIDPSAALRGR